MITVFPQLSMDIKARGSASYVMDAVLALSPFGLPLAKRLGDLMDVWVTRELWHIVDNAHTYRYCPEQLSKDSRLETTACVWRDAQPVLQELQAWSQLQANPGSSKAQVYYFADSQQESLLPENLAASGIWKFEALSSSLDNRLQVKTPLASSLSGTLALAASLSTAVVLTCLPDEGSLPPLICQNATSWGLVVECIPVTDAWLQMERDFIRQQLVVAGLAKLQWAGLKLAVLHVYLPNVAPGDEVDAQPMDFYGDRGTGMDEKGNLTETDSWQDARCYWYPL